MLKEGARSGRLSPVPFPVQQDDQESRRRGQSICDKNRDLITKDSWPFNINPRPLGLFPPLASLSRFFAPQRSISGLSERAFAGNRQARIENPHFLASNNSRERPEPIFSSHLTFTGTGFDNFFEFVPRRGNIILPNRQQWPNSKHKM